MQEWFAKLEFREKMLVMLAGIFVVFFILFQWIWSPIHSANKEIISNIQSAQQTLLLLEQAKPLIKLAAQNNNVSMAATPITDEGDIFSTVDHYFQQIRLKKFIQNFTGQGQNQVSMELKGMPFDRLMAALVQLWQQKKIKVIGINLTPAATEGTVNGQLRLQQ